MPKKPRRYTRLTPTQRLLLAQIVTAFPDAKASDIARMANVSPPTVYNAARPVLEGAQFFK